MRSLLPTLLAFATVASLTPGCRPRSTVNGVDAAQREVAGIGAPRDAEVSGTPLPYPTGMDEASLRARTDWRARILASGHLDDAARASMERGREIFERTFTVKDGLGPYYNNTACMNCHSIPRLLGRGPVAEAAHAIGGGYVDGTALFPRHALPGVASFQVPAGWVPLGDRVPPPLFGLGWLEAIPAEQIFARKHTETPEPPPTTVNGWARARPGIGRGSHRFASKMVVSTIDEFVIGAFRMEMGLTSPQRDFERDGDEVPDPEVSPAMIADVANFIALSPAPGQPLPPSDRPAMERFRKVGCADCHEGNFTVEGKAAPQMYTDVLGHFMGAARAEAMRDEMSPAGHYRTTPLWGLRDNPGPYLHDGAAPTLEAAILMHDGEAAAARARFKELPRADKNALLLMLQHL